MKKCIAIDMDCVMADLYDGFVAFEEKVSGKKIDRQAVRGVPIVKAFPSCRDFLRQEGVYEFAPVMDGAVETIKYLNEKYRVLIVSAATEYPNSMREKMAWLAEHFPYLHWKQFVFCGTKDFVRADIMIDDKISNLDAFDGSTKILFAQPHNEGVQKDGVVRLDWRGIREFL